MKKTLLVAAGAFALSLGSASAADLAARPYTKAPPMLAPVPIANWSGLYVGVNIGFGGDRTEYPLTGAGFAGELTATSSGFLGGGQIGYNWQNGNFVYGLETDIQLSDVKTKITAVLGPLSLSAGTRVDYFGTVRGRIGHTFGPALLYATGGFAYGQTKTHLTINPGLLAFSQENDKAGWTVGAGLEYSLLPSWTFKTEYLYVDLGRDNVFTGGGATIAEDTHFHVVRAGLNYKFWNAPGY